MKPKFKIGEYVYHRSRQCYGIIKGLSGAEVDILYVSSVLGDHEHLIGNIQAKHWSVVNLEYIRIKDTKIARKMNKNNIGKIEKGWIYLKGE